MNMIKNPVLQFIIWALLLSHPAFAQDSVQIEIDSAQVDVGIEKPSEADKKADKGKSRVSPAIWIGGLAAAVAAAVGGGGSGGGNSATTHAPGTQ